MWTCVKRRGGHAGSDPQQRIAGGEIKRTEIALARDARGRLRNSREARGRACTLTGQKSTRGREEKDGGTCGKSHTFATPLVPGRALAVAIK